MASIAAQPRVNVLDPEFYVDPWDAYRWLREEAPVFWDPVQRLWVISRYEDLQAVEKDGERYSSFYGSRPHTDQTDDRSMINMDNPAHRTSAAWCSAGSRRGPFAATRSGYAIWSRRSSMRSSPLGECEAVEAIASRLPAMMIGEMLGYPPEMWERVRFWSERTMLLGGQTSPDGPPHFTDPALIPVMTEWHEITIRAHRGPPRGAAR